MTNITSREIRLASRPTGRPIAENFTLTLDTLEPPQDGEVLVRNLYMSVDPYMRGRAGGGCVHRPLRREKRRQDGSQAGLKKGVAGGTDFNS
jgi:N-terminal domain of oxidoreductase